MNLYDIYQRDDGYIEKNMYYGIKRNIKRKDIFNSFGLPYSEERIIYYKDSTVMLIILDYSTDSINFDLWKNGSVLHLHGVGRYDTPSNIESLNLVDRTLYNLDRNGIIIHLFWSDEGDRYKYGHIMVRQDVPYQIEEIDENGLLKYVWIFPLLPVDISYKMDKKYSFYKERVDICKREIVKKTKEEIYLNTCEDILMVAEINNVSIISNDDMLSLIDTPKEKKSPRKEKGKLIYNRDLAIAVRALQYAGFECEIDNNHESFLRRKSNKKYMEPHHLVPMSYSDNFEISLDVEANIVSLCSNCHNNIHYGVEAKGLLIKLYNSRKERLKLSGINITLEELLQMYELNEGNELCK